MVYGIGQRMPANIETWRQHGYTVHVMTGVAWGQYQDYLNGRFDGQNHWDQAQTQADGKLILHGGNREIPYISPGENYGKYLTAGGQASARRRRAGHPPGRTRVLGEGRMGGEFQTGMEGLLQRGLAGSELVSRCPISRVQAQILFVSTGAFPDLRFREGVRQGQQPNHPLLCPDALPDQLRALEDRQSRVVVDRCGRRRLHRAGLDRHGADRQPLRRPPQGADVRNRVSRIRRDAEPGARLRPAGVVSERPD